MFLHVKSVRWLRDYELELEFTDGSIKVVDLADQLYGVVFEPLRDPATFRAVALNTESGTIEWPNGADFAPEFLFENGRDVEHVA